MPSAVLLSFEEYPNPRSGACGAAEGGPDTWHPPREETGAVAIPLVVGIDGSEASLEAVDWAADEAVRHERAAPPRACGGRDHEASDVIAAASERAREETLPRCGCRARCCTRTRPLPSSTRGATPSRWCSGPEGSETSPDCSWASVSLAVAARADCPVVVVRGAAEHRDGRFGNIVVGVEDGEGSGTALQFAFREAHVRRCRLTAVHAWNPPSRALTTRPAPSWYAMEAHRRPPSQVLDDALRGPAERYRDARGEPPG